MRIKKMICSTGITGFYFDDQLAIRQGAVADGSRYIGEPATPGFSSVRQPGESISVMIVLDDNQIAWGDCAAVQYSGAGGRDQLFLAADFIPVIEKYVAPHFEGREISTFRELAAELADIRVEGKKLHTAIRYGVSQALLDAVARSNHQMMCEVIAEEYDLTISEEMIPIFSQSGDSRYDNADKMIIKGVPVLPHALINNIDKLGQKGEKLLDYVKWLVKRIRQIRPEESYQPTIQIDVYGTIGIAFGHDNIDAMADYLAELEKAARPFSLKVEGPLDAGSRAAQIKYMSELTAELDRREIAVELVADEWCNNFDDVCAFVDARAGHIVQVKTPDLGGLDETIAAMRYCKDNGIGAYQGGTCNETDRSAQICVHVAMAVAADQLLAKPGMGVDEGIMIAYNEMQRILVLRKAGADFAQGTA
ncbi:MAG: methylaspartate ammonia-lyase [Clostridiaceae bacterium]|jgi:methylaspartate ammonia-lyase|nr:methylaspartate ammonia-lyase [Clostridiaceae bacterium]